MKFWGFFVLRLDCKCHQRTSGCLADQFLNNVLQSTVGQETLKQYFSQQNEYFNLLKKFTFSQDWGRQSYLPDPKWFSYPGLINPSFTKFLCSQSKLAYFCTDLCLTCSETASKHRSPGQRQMWNANKNKASGTLEMQDDHFFSFFFFLHHFKVKNLQKIHADGKLINITYFQRHSLSSQIKSDLRLDQGKTEKVIFQQFCFCSAED